MKPWLRASCHIQDSVRGRPIHFVIESNCRGKGGGPEDVQAGLKPPFLTLLILRGETGSESEGCYYRKRKGNQTRRVLRNRKRKRSQWSPNLSQWSQNLSQWSQKLSHLLLQKGLNLMLVMPLSPMKRHQGNDLPSVALLLLLLMKDLMQRQRHQNFQAECNGNDRVMTHNYQSCPFIKSNSLPVALCFRQAFSSILVQECKRVGCEVG